MDIIRTAPRLHPLMAAAAVSVVTVCIAGTAAITGLLPTSRGATVAPLLAAPAPVAPVAMAAPVAMPAAVEQPVVAAPAPVIKRVAQQPKVVHRTTRVVRHEAPSYQAPVAQAPAPARPNYVGIGTGAVIGGLLGNQIGSGNGRKLATVAGVIGGGFLGNEIANRQQQQ